MTFDGFLFLDFFVDICDVLIECTHPVVHAFVQLGTFLFLFGQVQLVQLIGAVELRDFPEAF